MNKFNVLTWDFNKDAVAYYDVMPYFRQAYQFRVKTSKKYKNNEELDEYFKVPVTYDEVKDFIRREAQYQFWGRCEYEFIMHGWPVRKESYKIDVYEQIMMNIDVVAKMFYDEL